MHSFACICYIEVQELIDGNNIDCFTRLAVVSNYSRHRQTPRASTCNLAESAFLARYSTSKAALKVMSIGRVPADGFTVGRYPPIRSAKSHGDVETGHNIHAVPQTLPDDNQLRSQPRNSPSHCRGTHSKYLSR